MKKINELTLIKEPKHFDLIKTFECGQCFRWNHNNDHYYGVLGDYVLRLKDKGNNIHVEMFSNIKKPRPLDINSYFDIENSYKKASDELASRDDVLKESVEFGRGIRILKQDTFETLISFIISANNNIPKIKLSIEDLCYKFGTIIGNLDGKDFYSFPSPIQLSKATPEEIAKTRAIGYRARSVGEAAQKVYTKEFSLHALTEQEESKAREQLKTLHGVGDKVANCVLLFGAGHDQCFPVDTWVRKVLAETYGVEKSIKEMQTFINDRFSPYKGLAQQYLFYYVRERARRLGGAGRK